MLDELNRKPFKQLSSNRELAFAQLDQPALKPLPRHLYRYVAIKTVKVNIDYHVSLQYVDEHLELHAGDTQITLYFRGQAMATHALKFPPAPPQSPLTCRSDTASTNSGHLGG